MFKLDNDFLDEIGLGGMPDEQKAPFLAHIQEELEIRIGEKMSKGLTEAQIEEFEKIIDGDESVIQGILDEQGDYKSDKIYSALIEKAGYQDGSPELINEYVSVKWLTKNRPDYQQIVEEVATALKAEVESNKESILSGGAQIG
jgi:protein-tyrosine-phosphatase